MRAPVLALSLLALAVFGWPALLLLTAPGCARPVVAGPQASVIAVRSACDERARAIVERARSGLVSVDSAKEELSALEKRCEDAFDVVGGVHGDR